jgi:micrococcal nuclease
MEYTPKRCAKPNTKRATKHCSKVTVNLALFVLALFGTATSSAFADRIEFRNGAVWDDVEITAFQVDGGASEFYVEPGAHPSPAGIRPGWYSGIARVQFARDGREEAAVAAPRASEYPPIEARVAATVQADTLRLDSGQKVRLLGVDAPETTDPDQPLEFFGGEAFRYTQEKAEGRRVRIEFGPRRMDNFGRLLGYVYVLPEDRMLNVDLLESGHAHAWTGEPMDDAMAARFREAETLARTRHLGLWNVEKREASRRDWQFVDSAELMARAPEKEDRRRAPSRIGSSSSRSYTSRYRPNRRSITVGVEYSERPVPIFIGPGFAVGRQTEITVSPR